MPAELDLAEIRKLLEQTHEFHRTRAIDLLLAEVERYKRLFGESSYADAMQALTDARARIEELETTLCEVLRTFYDKGHPGYAAFRSTWVRVESLEKWRRTAAGGAGNV